jgi:hypothetical protein
MEKAIGVRWPEINSSDLKITLYMTLGQGGEG